MNEVDVLLAIGERMQKEQLSRKELLLANNGVNVTDDEVGSLPRLIYNHCMNKTTLRKQTPFSVNAFQERIQEAIDNGVITEPVYHNKQHLFTRHDIAALWDHWEFETYRDHHKPAAIAVENQKGGTGKSNSTAMLATATALDLKTNAKVLVMEFDPQGSLGQSMINQMAVDDDAIYLTAVDLTLGELEDEGDYRDLINDGYTQEEIILAAPFNTHLPNLDVMPAFATDERFLNTFWRADSDTQMMIIRELSEKIIPVLKQKYDIIYIDTPPQESPLVWIVNEALDGLIIPITPREYDYASTVNYTITTGIRFGHLPSKGTNLKWFRFLVVNHDEKSHSEIETVSKLARTAQDRLLSSHIIHSELIVHAGSQNRTALDVAKSEKACSSAKHDDAITSVTQVYKQIIREIKAFSVKDAA